MSNKPNTDIEGLDETMRVFELLPILPNEGPGWVVHSRRADKVNERYQIQTRHPRNKEWVAVLSFSKKWRATRFIKKFEYSSPYRAVDTWSRIVFEKTYRANSEEIEDEEMTNEGMTENTVYVSFDSPHPTGPARLVAQRASSLLPGFETSNYWWALDGKTYHEDEMANIRPLYHPY